MFYEGYFQLNPAAGMLDAGRKVSWRFRKELHDILTNTILQIAAPGIFNQHAALLSLQIPQLGRTGQYYPSMLVQVVSEYI